MVSRSVVSDILPPLLRNHQRLLTVNVRPLVSLEPQQYQKRSSPFFNSSDYIFGMSSEGGLIRKEYWDCQERLKNRSASLAKARADMEERGKSIGPYT